MLANTYMNVLWNVQLSMTCSASTIRKINVLEYVMRMPVQSR
jgi:hypothetical protein